MPELRVVIAEDSYLVREGTRRLLEARDDVEVVAALGSAEELITAIEANRPDAVLTDIRMPPSYRTEGIQAAHEIRRRFPDTGVVVLSQHADPRYVLDLFAHGADGLAYLLKERVGDREQLVAALHETRRGGSVIDPMLVDDLVKRRRLDDSALAHLSPRELDVLRAMSRGCSNAAVAEQLFCSESSVEKHVSSIFSKLGLAEEPRLHRRVAAVVTYLQTDDQR